MNTYSIVLALHLIGITTWMVMLIYLPKLFVYHLVAPQAAKSSFTMQEENLYKAGTAAMLFAILCGLVLLYLNPYLFKSGGWLHLKLTLAFLLVVYHFTCKKYIVQLKDAANEKNIRFFRYFRIIPELLTSLIILLTIIKPF